MLPLHSGKGQMAFIDQPYEVISINTCQTSFSSTAEPMNDFSDPFAMVWSNDGMIRRTSLQILTDGWLRWTNFSKFAIVFDFFLTFRTGSNSQQKHALFGMRTFPTNVCSHDAFILFPSNYDTQEVECIDVGPSYAEILTRRLRLRFR